jgi:C_GCAxxG_C_C family probable redox protein
MNKSERIDRCRELKSAVNCAQAVAIGFADVAGMDQDTISRCAQAYGSGLATMDGTCGALTGAGLVIGLAIPDKVSARKSMATVMQRFKTRNGSTVCKDLKGVATGCPLRSCVDCVADAASFLCDELNIK